MRKMAAEDANKRAGGVRTVAQDLTVRVTIDYKHARGIVLDLASRSAGA